MASSSSWAPPQFKNFDIVSDVSDHRFVEQPPIFNGGGAYKRIMKEWRVLETSLPDTIYVRAYDTRIDLMRAAIVGPPGTPYHDGLFFFDIRFPSEYPNRPPFFRYCSYSLRINPNIYASGHICLSLLNTWSGCRSEMWDPETSTVLQVLVSLQGLVLNEQPMVNEPPGSYAVKSTRNFGLLSEVYNGNVFGLTCRTAAALVVNKPRGFEELVAGHFGERGEWILRAGKAYARGATRVGWYGREGGRDIFVPIGRRARRRRRLDSAEIWKAYGEAIEVECSKLARVLEENGIHVQVDHKEEEEEEEEEKGSKAPGTVGVLRRVVGKLRKVFFGANKAKKEEDKKREFEEILNELRFMLHHGATQ